MQIISWWSLSSIWNEQNYPKPNLPDRPIDHDAKLSRIGLWELLLLWPNTLSLLALAFHHLHTPKMSTFPYWIHAELNWLWTKLSVKTTSHLRLSWLSWNNQVDLIKIISKEDKSRWNNVILGALYNEPLPAETVPQLNSPFCAIIDWKSSTINCIWLYSKW